MASTQRTQLITQQLQQEAEGKLLRRRNRQKFILKSILANVVIVIFIIFAVFPIYFLVLAAFRPGQALYSTNLELIPTSVTLDNFDHMINHTPLFTWLGN